MKIMKDRFDTLLQKAQEGNAKSQYKLSKWLYKGYLVEKNHEAAKYWAFKAVSNGYNKAGLFFEKLDSITKL